MEWESGKQVVHIGYCNVKHDMCVKGNTIKQKRDIMV